MICSVCGADKPKKNYRLFDGKYYSRQCNDCINAKQRIKRRAERASIDCLNEPKHTREEENYNRIYGKYPTQQEINYLKREHFDFYREKIYANLQQLRNTFPNQY